MIKDCVQCGVQNAYAYPHTWRSPLRGLGAREGNPDTETPIALTCEYCTRVNASECKIAIARAQWDRHLRNQAKIAQWKEEEC